MANGPACGLGKEAGEALEQQWPTNVESARAIPAAGRRIPGPGRNPSRPSPGSYRELLGACIQRQMDNLPAVAQATCG